MKLITMSIDVVGNEDDYWQFRLSMSQAIKVTSNFTDWSSDNEGQDKISIKFIAGTETKKYLEDS